MREINQDPLKVINLAQDYSPSNDQEYMSTQMLEYFRQKLLDWRKQVLQESSDSIVGMQDQLPNEPDNVDCAMLERERDSELRRLVHDKDLLLDIDAALDRIEKGTYGYCEETGDPIGLERLEVWPIASLTIQAQEMKEEKNL